MSEGAAEPPTAQKTWSAEQLAGLDWKLLVELARALAASAGFTLGKTKVPTSGAAEFIMQQRVSGLKQRSLVRMAPWNRWMASVDCLRDFAQALARERPTAHGIYLAPGGIAESALLVAQRHDIEMVDAEAMARQLNALSPDHSAFYYEVGMTGDVQTPSCPVCLQPLKLITGSSDPEEDFEALKDATFKGHVIVGDLIRARRVEVQSQSEVQFLHEVRAKDVIVDGIAMGDFHCRGRLTLNPGATLYGRVSARSVEVSAGAALHGETMILDNLPQTTTGDQPVVSLWRCKNPEPKPRCFAVAFTPHQ